MLIPSSCGSVIVFVTSLSRRVNANSQHIFDIGFQHVKLIKKGEC